MRIFDHKQFHSIKMAKREKLILNGGKPQKECKLLSVDMRDFGRPLKKKRCKFYAVVEIRQIIKHRKNQHIKLNGKGNSCN